MLRELLFFTPAATKLFKPKNTSFRLHMDKKQILLDSVRKLLALEGVSEKDIIENLQSVGLSQEQAAALIKEAKSQQVQEQPQKEQPLSPRQQARPMAEELPKPSAGFRKARKQELGEFEKEIVAGSPAQKMQEEQVENADELFSEAQEEIAPKKPEKKPLQSQPVRQNYLQPAPQAERAFEHVDLSKLWETGVITAVNAKLEEMRSLKKDIDFNIGSKVNEAVDRESGKIRGFFDAQRELNNSRLSSIASEKTAEFTEVIDAKLSEMRQLNSSIQDNTVKLDAKSQVTAELLNNVNEKLADLEKTKSRLISSMNAELIMSKSKVEGFVNEAQKKLADLDLRVTKTLELESKIAEGLLGDAENKIAAIVDQKTSGIDRKLNEKISELNSIQERVDPRIVEEKLMSAIEDAESRTNALVNDANSRIDAVISERMAPMTGEIEAKVRELEDIQARVDPAMMEKRLVELEKRFERDAEELRQKMQDFNLFKEQFISIVEKNTQSFNKSIKEFNEERQKQSAQIDKKIKELEDFEKSFAEEMGLMVDKISEGKEKPEGQKKKK